MQNTPQVNLKKHLIRSSAPFKSLTCRRFQALLVAILIGVSSTYNEPTRAQENAAESAAPQESKSDNPEPAAASTQSEGPGSSTASSPSPTHSAPSSRSQIRKITDDEWSQIAGEKTSQNFPVEKGNTLWGISKDLFGDPLYWPKIWALNNGTILNPHVIKPGQQVTFQGGSSSTLPSIGVQDASRNNAPANAAPTISSPSSDIEIADPQAPKPAAPESNPLESEAPTSVGLAVQQGNSRPLVPEPSSLSDPSRSREWMKLPQQAWENSQGEEVTAQNLIHDQVKDNSGAPVRLRSWPDRGIQLEGLPDSEQMTGIATIVGSRKEGLVLGKGDMIYIEADTELIEGETYGITSEEPSLMKTRKSDRSGWLHPYLGKVRVLAVKEGVYVGEILESAGHIQRDDILIPLPAKVFPKQPIPAANPIEATLLLNKDTSMYATSQFKQVLIDRGSGDGVYPGMVFRSYQYWDPGTGDRITDSDFIIDADILVVHSSEDFSVGIVLSSLSPVTEGSTLVLLTDIGDVLDKNGYRLRTQEEVKRDQELKELDQLPPQNQLEEAERRELEQLEKWQKNPDGTEELIDDPEKVKEVTEDTSEALEEQGQKGEGAAEAQAADDGLVAPEQPEQSSTEDNPPPPPPEDAEESPPPPPPDLPNLENSPVNTESSENSESPNRTEGAPSDETTGSESEATPPPEPAGDTVKKADDYPQDEPIQGN